MNVTLENKADQTAIIRIDLVEADYAQAVEKALKDYKKNAKVPGFRPGMVPMGLVNKMYRKGTLADQTYRMASQEAFKHIEDNKIETLGDMMPAAEQPELDFDNQTEFQFVFQVGIAPEVKIALTKKDKVEKIVVTPTDEMQTSFKENFLRRFGKLVDVDKVVKEEAVNVTLDNKDIKIEEAYVGLISMNDDERKPFIGKKIGDKMAVNINTLYPDPKQRAAILSLNESELGTLNPEFELEITKIRAFQNPELNEAFFTEAFPEKDITSKEQFDAKMAADLQEELDSQTVFSFHNSVRDAILAKVNPSLPEQFLKEWLFQINEGKFTMEQIENEFPQFSQMMKWDIVKREIAKEAKLEVTADDAMAEAKQMALQQFKYYGMANPGDEMLTNYANQILGSKEEARKIYDRVADNKVIDAIVEKITVAEKKMTVDQFSEMMKADKK